MKNNKELTIVIYDNFERKKVLLIKKAYIKYILLTVSFTFFGFIAFFIIFLNTRFEDKLEEKIDLQNQISNNNLKELNQTLLQKIDATNNFENIYTIENIKFYKNNFSFNLKNSSSDNNINAYLILLFRTKNLIYSYPSAVSLDANRISTDYYKGEEFFLKQNKNFSISVPFFNNEKYSSVLVYIYSKNGILNYSKSFDLGDFYE